MGKRRKDSSFAVWVKKGGGTAAGISNRTKASGEPEIKSTYGGLESGSTRPLRYVFANKLPLSYCLRAIVP